jgi:hypothetical protein
MRQGIRYTPFSMHRGAYLVHLTGGPGVTQFAAVDRPREAAVDDGAHTDQTGGKSLPTVSPCLSSLHCS